MEHKHSKCTEINAIKVNINLSYTELSTQRNTKSEKDIIY